MTGSIVSGDFNGDGKADLAFLGTGTVLLGNGDGAFNVTNLPIEQGKDAYLPSAVGDFSGDGLSDLVAVETMCLGARTCDSEYVRTSTILPSFIRTASTPAIAISPADSGPHKIVASYAGSASYDASSSSSISVMTFTTVSLSAGSLTFGSQNLDTKSAAQIVTLKNTGDESLTIHSIGLSGVDASSFQSTSSCPSTLSKGISCTISILFKPLRTGTDTASLAISDTAANTPQYVALT
jgi:hypothetical protein